MKLNEPLLHEADERGRPSSVTLVTGLFDLGRGKLKDDAEFKRPFSEYIRRFRSFLAYKLPKIAFIQREHYEQVRCAQISPNNRATISALLYVEAAAPTKVAAAGSTFARNFGLLLQAHHSSTGIVCFQCVFCRSNKSRTKSAAGPRNSCFCHWRTSKHFRTSTKCSAFVQKKLGIALLISYHGPHRCVSCHESGLICTQSVVLYSSYLADSCSVCCLRTMVDVAPVVFVLHKRWNQAAD